jgi:hypothetical protein
VWCGEVSAWSLLFLLVCEHCRPQADIPNLSSPTSSCPDSPLFAAVAGYYAYTTATEWSQMDKPPVRVDQIDYTFYASYGCMAIAAILLLMAVCLRTSIQLAITCVQYGGAAINSMSLLLLVPFLQVCGFLALYVF